jgi:hypothetical protein
MSPAQSLPARPTPAWLRRCPTLFIGDPQTWCGRIAPVIVRREVVQVLSLSASCAQAQKSLEHSVEQKSHSCANLAPQTRHIPHRLSCASVPPDFIDQKEKGISDQSEGEIDESGVFHCFPHYKCTLTRGLFHSAVPFELGKGQNAGSYGHTRAGPTAKGTVNARRQRPRQLIIVVADKAASRAEGVASISTGPNLNHCEAIPYDRG